MLGWARRDQPSTGTSRAHLWPLFRGFQHSGPPFGSYLPGRAPISELSWRIAAALSNLGTCGSPDVAVHTALAYLRRTFEPHKSNSVDRLVKCTLPSTVCIWMYAAHADKTLDQPVPESDSLRDDQHLYLARRKTLIVGLLPPISGAKRLTTPTYPDTTATC
jgi:hypothetical protein